MDLTALAILAGLALVLLLLPVFGTLFIAGIAGAIFVWRKAFPLGWGIAEWVTSRRNLIPFVLFLLIVIAGSIILLILSYLFATQVHAIGFLFLLLFLLILVVAEIIFWGGIGLAVILWIIRLSHWAYAIFRRGFWRTFRPGGPPDFQPVPVPLTNPSSVAPPRSKHTGNRRRKSLARRRTITSTSLAPPTQEKAQLKDDTMRRQPAARRRQTSPTKLTPPSNEKALVGVEAKKAKAQAKVDAKQAKIQAKEDAKQAKAQAKEDKKAQSIAISEEKTRDQEEAKKARVEHKAQVEDQADLKEEEKGKGAPRLRRKRRLKGNKSL